MNAKIIAVLGTVIAVGLLTASVVLSTRSEEVLSAEAYYRDRDEAADNQNGPGPGDDEGPAGTFAGGPTGPNGESLPAGAEIGQTVQFGEDGAPSVQPSLRAQAPQSLRRQGNARELTPEERAAREARMAWAQEAFEFPVAEGPDEAVEVFATESVALDSAASEVLAGERVDQRLSLTEVYRSLVTPLIAADPEALEAAFLALGAVSQAPQENDGEAPKVSESIHEQFSVALEGATFDLGRATIDRSPSVVAAVPRSPDIPGMSFVPRGGAFVMSTIERYTDDDGNETELKSLLVPVADLFGVKELASQPGVVEVFAPGRAAGTTGEQADFALSTFLVWDSGARQWKPVGFRLGVRNNNVYDRIMDAVRDSRGG
ncbi:MAG: hypothetical protein AAGI17_07825 [Planctomycetota bacterium]